MAAGAFPYVRAEQVGWTTTYADAAASRAASLPGPLLATLPGRMPCQAPPRWRRSRARNASRSPAVQGARERQARSPQSRSRPGTQVSRAVCSCITALRMNDILNCRWERDCDRVCAPVENGSRHLRFAGYDPPALCDEEDDHVPRPRHRDILLSRLASAAGVPSSESRVKRGNRIVGVDTELVEKLGRNDLCPCGSGRRFPPLLPENRPFRRSAGRLLRPGLVRTDAARFATAVPQPPWRTHSSDPIRAGPLPSSAR